MRPLVWKWKSNLTLSQKNAPKLQGSFYFGKLDFGFWGMLLVLGFSS
jgi:hypothetical protein